MRLARHCSGGKKKQRVLRLENDLKMSSTGPRSVGEATAQHVAMTCPFTRSMCGAGRRLRRRRRTQFVLPFSPRWGFIQTSECKKKKKNSLNTTPRTFSTPHALLCSPPIVFTTCVG